MDDPAWKLGSVAGGDWENVTTRRPAAEATNAYILIDAKNLYVGFVAQQLNVPIVATQSTNDVGFGSDDFVALGIDTSGSGSRAYFFETTPRGVRYEQASENVRYRPTWQSATVVNGTTWRAVMIIPLNVLRLQPSATQTWRVGFFRSVAALAEHLTWAYNPVMQDAGAGSWPSFNDLRFWPSTKGVVIAAGAAAKPKPRLEVYGLSSSGRDRNLYQQADGTFAFEKTRSLGADLSVPINSTINFVMTANPDFSNVEIDQQTIAPQEFARQLAEYRPFFAQGANYLNPNPAGYTNFAAPEDEVFYSPSVGPFDSGEKIEGTYGLQSLGALSFRGFNRVGGEAFDDQAFGFRHALPDQAFQYWADGVLAHHSIAGTDDTFEFGGRARNLRDGWDAMLDGAIETGSWVPLGVAHSMHGFINLLKPNYETIAEYVDISPTYNPLDGFTTVADTRGPSGYINLIGAAPEIKNCSFFIQGDRLLDHTGAVHEADFNAYFSAVFKDGFSINAMGPSMSELRSYDGNFYGGYPSYTKGDTIPFNLMGIPLGFGDGTSAPIDVSGSWGSFGGKWLHLYIAQTSRPLGSKYTIGLEYDGSTERTLRGGSLDSQWLRRFSIGSNLGHSSNLILTVRSINGRGGFSTEPGVNFALAFHEKMTAGDLYVNYGSPSAFATLNRLAMKYVLRVGGEAWT
jgi:hypothetical protein